MVVASRSLSILFYLVIVKTNQDANGLYYTK